MNRLGRSARGFASAATEHGPLDGRYQVRAACLLQRPPVTMKALGPLEAAYDTYRALVEGEASRGIFHIASTSTPAPPSPDARQQASEEAEAAAKTAQHPAYAQAPVTDLRRLLDRKLYLLVRDPHAPHWCLPSKPVHSDEAPLGRLAREGLAEAFDVSRADIYWVGHAPVAFHQQALEGRIKPPLGIKSFVFPGQIIGGHFRQLEAGERREFGWFTKEEAEQLMSPSAFSGIQRALSY